MRHGVGFVRGRAAAALGVTLVVLALGGLACSHPVDMPTVAITADDDGFAPATIHARRGHPLTLIVTRRSDETCADSMLFADGRRVALPLDRPVSIPIATDTPGTLRYVCPMNMFKGKVVVQ